MVAKPPIGRVDKPEVDRHRRRSVLALGAACAGGLGSQHLLAQTPPAHCPALLAREFLRLQDEKPVPLCRFAGQVLLVVNTASFCGFTDQYRGLEALHRRFEARGFTVLGFPSNDFGGQEPGSSREIAALCENTFGVRFPLFIKSRVAASAGAARNPLFADLARLSGQSPTWNFHKYLVSRDGREVRSFSSQTSPASPDLVAEVTRLVNRA